MQARLPRAGRRGRYREVALHGVALHGFVALALYHFFRTFFLTVFQV
jgi:hypothetical protein